MQNIQQLAPGAELAITPAGSVRYLGFDGTTVTLEIKGEDHVITLRASEFNRVPMPPRRRRGGAKNPVRDNRQTVLVAGRESDTPATEAELDAIDADAFAPADAGGAGAIDADEFVP